MPEWDATLRMSLFRERLLARLLDRDAISPKGRHAGTTVGEAGGGSGAAGSRSARRVSDLRCGSEVRQGRRVVDRRLIFRC
jgi:hypothetical protein